MLHTSEKLLGWKRNPSSYFGFEREEGLKRSFKICAGQKMMIFILVGHSNRQAAGRWQHSGRTISIVVHEVAAACMSYQESFFLKKGAEDPPSTLTKKEICDLF